MASEQWQGTASSEWQTVVTDRVGDAGLSNAVIGAAATMLASLATDLAAERTAYNKLSGQLYTTQLATGVESRLVGGVQVVDPATAAAGRSARVGPFPYCLRDLYWGNVFGPPYTELFGADRLRTAPAAVVTELRPGYFYLQVTDSILDLWNAATVPAYEAARDAVKEHLGPECFYDPAATTPRRAPIFRNSAEEGLWKPREGDRLGPGVKELLARIADQAKQGDQ